MEYQKIPIKDIELDLDNPRIKKWLEIYGTNISAEAIALALSSSSGDSSTSFSSLKESIKVNKGIFNPIIVNKESSGRMVVVEGNTRLQIYKEFAEVDPDGSWNEIMSILYDDLPVEQIHAIRLQAHMVGPRDWDPFSKAKYLNQLSNIDKMPMSMIISFCGGKQNEINKLIDAYNDMVKFYFPIVVEMGMDPDPREFSKFSELQNRSIKDALAIHRYTREDFAKWVINGNIDNAQNVRKIPAILRNEIALEEFLKSNITEAEKYLNAEEKSNKNLSNVTLNELVKALSLKLNKLGWSEVASLRDDPRCENQKNDILDLVDDLNSLIKEIGG